MSFKIISFIILLSFNFSFAHKSKVKFENFGNVKTYFVSGFNYGNKTIEAEELKIQIIGKLSRRICEKLKYKDTLLVEYQTYYFQNPLFILENNNSNYRILGFKNGKVMRTNNNGISISIINKKISIDDVLKLVEYSIKNRKSLNNHLKVEDYFYGTDSKISVMANSSDFIENITKKESKIVDEIKKEKIELVNNSLLRTALYWEKGYFYFNINNGGKEPYEQNYNDELKIEDFYYFLDSPYSNYFFVFTDKNHFFYFDGIKEHTSELNEIPNKIDNSIFYLTKENFEKNIIFYDSGDYFYVYNKLKKEIKRIE